MHLQHVLVAATLAVLALADSIALSSFNPRVENLPSACDKVYNSPIAGCSSKDFQTTCSSSCINGLVAISKAVAASCGNADVPETSIIGVFLLGQGIPALCSNTVVTTVGTSDAPAATSAAASSSKAVASSSTAITVDPSSTLSTAVKSSASSSAAESSAAVTSAPAASSATSANFGLSSTSTTSSAAAKKSGKAQLSNSSSGGGSPFDVQATGKAPRQAPRGVLALVVGLIGMMVMVR